MKTGEISSVLPVGKAFMVIKVLDQVPAHQKSFDEARTVIPLMHDEAFLWVTSAKEQRLHRPNLLRVALNHCVTETQLHFSQRRHNIHILVVFIGHWQALPRHLRSLAR